MRSRRRGGFTILELMVSAFILAAMSLALVMIYSTASTMFQRGSGRLTMQQRSREAVRRVAPLIAGAIPPSESDVALYSPAVGATDDALGFYSAQDLFGTGPAFNPRAPYYPTYRIACVDSNIFTQSGGNVLVLEKLSDLSASPGHASLIPSVSKTLLSGTDSCAVKSVKFTRLDTSRVLMTITLTATQVRDAAGRLLTGAKSDDYTLQSEFQVPYYGVK